MRAVGEHDRACSMVLGSKPALKVAKGGSPSRPPLAPPLWKTMRTCLRGTMTRFQRHSWCLEQHRGCYSAWRYRGSVHLTKAPEPRLFFTHAARGTVMKKQPTPRHVEATAAGNRGGSSQPVDSPGQVTLGHSGCPRGQLGQIPVAKAAPETRGRPQGQAQGRPGAARLRVGGAGWARRRARNSGGAIEKAPWPTWGPGL